MTDLIYILKFLLVKSKKEWCLVHVADCVGNLGRLFCILSLYVQMPGRCGKFLQLVSHGCLVCLWDRCVETFPTYAYVHFAS